MNTGRQLRHHIMKVPKLVPIWLIEPKKIVAAFQLFSLSQNEILAKQPLSRIRQTRRTRRIALLDAALDPAGGRPLASLQLRAR